MSKTMSSLFEPPPVDNVGILLAMGFSEKQGLDALLASSNDLDKAINFLLSPSAPNAGSQLELLAGNANMDSLREVASYVADRPLHPRVAAMRPSQISPKPIHGTVFFLIQL
jgi:UBA/TS-N domain